jgi:hypothetical protein
MEPAHVEIDLGFFPLMWILYFIKPWLSVNGAAERRTWGKHQLTLAPGSYTFEAWYPYIFRSRTSPGSISLDLPPALPAGLAGLPRRQDDAGRGAGLAAGDRAPAAADVVGDLAGRSR